MRPVVALHGAGVQLPGRGAALTVLDGVELCVHAGERVALVGANGAGKTSLLRVLHGLQPLSSGRRSADAAVSVAMLFQQPHLLRLGVQTNVALGLWLRGTPWRQACTQALAALGRVGMAELAQRPAHKLSGGQQQRVALARAWALTPGLLLLDEPTASLDPHAKREVEALVADYASQRPEVTLVFASHNLGQVKRLATRVVYLEQGRIGADLPVDDFFGAQVLPAQYPAANAFVKGEFA